MTIARLDARAWTPDCAVRDGRIAARVSSLAEVWVRDWFASGQRPSLTVDFSLGSRRSKETDFCWLAEGLVLVISRRGLSLMGAEMANYLTPSSRGEDEAFLQGLAERAVVELWSSVMTLFDAKEPASRQAGASLDKAARIICRFGECAFELFIGDDRLAATRIALAQPVKHLASPGGRSDALARQCLDLSILVGDARIGLSAMKALAVGDVIVLDRNTHDDLELLVAGRRVSDLGCRLDRDGDTIALLITQPSYPTPTD